MIPPSSFDHESVLHERKKKDILHKYLYIDDG